MEHGRFQEHPKTCDTLNSHYYLCHAHRYRYPISYKIAKRGKSAEPIFLVIIRKCSLAKIGCGGDMLKNGSIRNSQHVFSQ